MSLQLFRTHNLCVFVVIMVSFGGEGWAPGRHLGGTPANQTRCDAGEDDVTVFERYGYRAAALVPENLRSYLPRCLQPGEVTPVLDEDGEASFLADGRYADLLLGRVSGSGQLVAIKSFRNSRRSNVLGEGAILGYLGDTGYVPRLLGVQPCHTHPGNASLVMELLPDCPSFGDVVFRHKLSLCQLLNVTFQLADAILAIHRKFVLHHDLHRENVLVHFQGRDPVVYIVDFGHATFRRSRSYTQPSRILRHYRVLSPEAKRHDVTSPASDVYSLGLMLRDVSERVGDVRLGRLARACTSDVPGERPKLWEVRRELGVLLSQCRVTHLQPAPQWHAGSGL